MPCLCESADELNKVKPLAADDNSRVFFDKNKDDDINKDGPQPDAILDKNNSHMGIRVTPRLTVWRKLHVESDWMTAPPKAEVFAKDLENLDVNPNGPIPQIATGLLVSAFQPLYIVVVTDTKNDHWVSWRHNLPRSVMQGRTEDRKTGVSQGYWAVAVIAAYEGESGADYDGELFAELGITSQNLGVDRSYVYTETIRDLIKDKNEGLGGQDLQDAIDKMRQRVAVHEVGHIFGLDDNDPLGPYDVMAIGEAADYTVDQFGNYDATFEKFMQSNALIIRKRSKP